MQLDSSSLPRTGPGPRETQLESAAHSPPFPTPTPPTGAASLQASVSTTAQQKWSSGPQRASRKPRDCVCSSQGPTEFKPNKMPCGSTICDSYLCPMNL